MPEEHGSSDKGEPKIHPVLDEPVGEEHDEDPLPRVQEQGQGSRRLPDGAHHVRRSDVPRPDLPEIDVPVEQPRYQDSEGNGAQEIGERDD